MAYVGIFGIFAIYQIVRIYRERYRWNLIIVIMNLVKASKEAHRKWRLIPAPQRGDVIRQFGNELRNNKS